MAVVTRSGAKVNTNGNAANVPKGPRRSARVKAAKDLKEQRLLTELGEKKKTLAVEQARATKRAQIAQIAQKSQARRKARAAEKAQASEKTQAVEKSATEQVVAVWKADFNEARALRRAQQKETLTAKQAALESRTDVLTIDQIERRKIDAQHRSNVPFYMSYKQFLDSSERRNSGYLERKAVENEWKSFCMTKFAKWRPDPAAFSVKLKNKRLKKALKEVCRVMIRQHMQKLIFGIRWSQEELMVERRSMLGGSGRKGTRHVEIKSHSMRTTNWSWPTWRRPRPPS